MGRILAIDYGEKRVGLAVTDPLKIIASALDTVNRKQVLEYLKAYVASEEVECLVLGMPTRLNGEATDATRGVEKFAGQLKKLFPAIPIEFEDERFTSQMALKSMVSAGVKKKNRRKKENIDKVSATLILQSYMESK
jgi:putative holliday junction resolvase